MHLVILGVDIAWNAIVETFTEGAGFVSKHLGNTLPSTGRSDPLISFKVKRSEPRETRTPRTFKYEVLFI